MARPKNKKRASKQSYSQKKRPVLAYPLFIFILLCTGVFLVGWTLRATAINIKVTARIPGPPVTNQATIETPTTGEHFNSIPIDINGNCPANAAYVEIFSNGVMKGSAICGPDFSYQISVDLFPGVNELVAHSFNITDDEGPVSATVSVFYDVPQPPPTVPNDGVGSPSSPSPEATPLLLIKTAFLYKGYYVGDKVEWPIEISGGNPPYALSIDWGDGTTDVISRGRPGKFNIAHTYSQAGGYKGSYEVKVKASDSKGKKAYLQFFVIISEDTQVAPVGSIYSKPPPRLGGSLRWLLVAWPAYGVVVLMTLSYILGEREEMIILRKNGMLKRRHP
jgi:hypothetical protein